LFAFLRNRQNQALRLLKQFRFHVDEVGILRRGHEIILREPQRNLGQSFAALGAMPAEFPALRVIE
jgi:virulence-associated protein VagC